MWTAVEVDLIWVGMIIENPKRPSPGKGDVRLGLIDYQKGSQVRNGACQPPPIPGSWWFH